MQKSSLFFLMACFLLSMTSCIPTIRYEEVPHNNTQGQLLARHIPGGGKINPILQGLTNAAEKGASGKYEPKSIVQNSEDRRIAKQEFIWLAGRGFAKHSFFLVSVSSLKIEADSKVALVLRRLATWDSVYPHQIVVRAIMNAPSVDGVHYERYNDCILNTAGITSADVIIKSKWFNGVILTYYNSLLDCRLSGREKIPQCSGGLFGESLYWCLNRLSSPIADGLSFDGQNDRVDITAAVKRAKQQGIDKLVIWLEGKTDSGGNPAYFWGGSAGKLFPYVEVKSDQPPRSRDAMQVVPHDPGGCTKDTDCKGDRLCKDRECVDPPSKRRSRSRKKR